LRGAVAQMITHQGASDGTQGFLNGRNLDKNVSTVAVFGHHSFDAAYLALDAVKAPQIRGASLWIDSYGLAPGLRFAAGSCFMSVTVRASHSYTPWGYCRTGGNEDASS
jgi:hypothetical protein